MAKIQFSEEEDEVLMGYIIDQENKNATEETGRLSIIYGSRTYHEREKGNKRGGHNSLRIQRNRGEVSEKTRNEKDYKTSRKRGKGKGKKQGVDDKVRQYRDPLQAQETRKKQTGRRGIQRGKIRDPNFHKLELSDLTEIAKCTTEEVVLKLQNDLKGFQQSLSCCNSVPDKSRTLYVCTIVKLLLIVCEATEKFQDEGAFVILSEFLSDRCSEFHILLKWYITRISIYDDQSESTLDTIYKLFKICLDSFPTSAWLSLPIDDLVAAVNELSLLPFNLKEKVGELKSQRDDIKRQQTEKKKVAVIDEEKWDNTLYRTLPILPSMDEICSSAPPPIRSNKITGAYTGWEHYYDVQFRLLREDFIAPLRRGVSMFCSAERTGRLTDIHVYNDVRLIKPEFTENGICYMVQFDTSRFHQRKSWTQSKRLIFGSLLCFSPKCDNFQEEVYFATITDRKPEELNHGIFHVHFEESLNMFQHVHKTVFTVLESKAYFEASRHILRSLQTAETDTMPFTRYLINNQPFPVNAPRYLEGDDTIPLYDIRWLYPEDPKTSSLRHKLASKECLIDITEEWPTENDVELDESQIKAIKMALTQEISVIQGPPGTGKTYIGYKIVQTLLQNRHIWDPKVSSPILVMCYTNHALDQFLQGIIHHKICRNFLAEPPNIVRIGGRSKSEEIQKCSLYNAKRRYVDSYDLRVVRRQKEELIKIASRIPWHSLQRVKQEPINEFIIGPEGMRRLRRIIHPRHFYQLNLLAREINGEEELSLEYWLGFWTKSVLPLHSGEKQIPQTTEILDTKQATLPSSETQEGQTQMTNNTVTEFNLPNSYTTTINDDDERMIQVKGEAEIEEANRRLDDDGYQQFQLMKDKEETGEIFDGWNEHIRQRKLRQKLLNEPKFFKYIKKNSTEIERIIKEIHNCNPFEREDEEGIQDVTELSDLERYQLFRLWILKYTEWLQQTSSKSLTHFQKEQKKYIKAQQKIDRIAIERADVIGMTTTGAAKYQHILHLVKPKIVIVEEAAEVLESHIVSALNAGTQHLILIGDHKQLRPKPNEYELAKKHNLEVSLFERLIRNGLSHATLLIQHRMRPQIASLVCPAIYETLINHESVKKYDNVRSCDKNMYFFHHTYPEASVEHLLSHSNDGEAELVVSLCRHFLKQGYDSSQITILTAYTGQLLCVKGKMPRKEFEGVQVTNVDNFQGEENDIIILSLVRSNDMKIVGFLKEENRVCVALSRAKMGFYCFGNFEMLQSVVFIWEFILKHVKEKGCFGSSLPLHCHNHPDFKVAIKQANEFAIYFPEGGCQQRCAYRLDCGHQCKRYCHVTDADHKEYKCQEQCPKLCANELHPCRARCFQECPPCTAMVNKIIPNCGHIQTMMCCDNPQDISCLSPCSKRCKNNLHGCPRKCSEKCTDCIVMIKYTMPKCRHVLDLPCSEDFAFAKCYYPCQKKCTAGLHDCPKECWEECEDCRVIMEKTIPRCGHKQSMLCCEDPNEFQCNEKCRKVYKKCGHFCSKMCYEECHPLCQKLVEKVIPKCSHKNMMPCYMDPEFAECTQPCKRRKNCGHPCKGQCGQLCAIYQCMVPKSLKLPCTHEAIVPCNDHLQSRITLLLHNTYECDKPCLKKLPCGHLCGNKCKEPCSTKQCEVDVLYRCPKGDHTIPIKCYQLQNPPICSNQCHQVLACGHQCKKKCNEECSEQCNVLVTKNCHCGHRHSFKCGDSTKCTCGKICSAVLQCGHKCSGMCGDCFTNRIHSPCIFQLQVNRFCGHSASLPCIGLLDRCEKPCRLSTCPHDRKNCDHKCCEDCPYEECHGKCIVECPHDKCSRECSDICDKPSCKEPCTKTLKCGHHCSGACGDKCLQYCIKCNSKKFCGNVRGLGKNFKGSNPPICLQLDCGHVYTINYLDQRFSTKSGHDKLISPLLCPTCSKPFISSHYWKISRSILDDVKLIKERLALISAEVDDDDFDCVLYSVEDILAEKEIITNHRLHYIFKRDAEGLCSLKLLRNAVNFLVEIDTSCLSECDNLIKDIENFIKVIVRIFIQTKGKLSLQLICDIESELFRLSLCGFQRIISMNSSKIDSSIQQLHDQLQLMEVDHNAHLNFQCYREVFQSVSHVCSPHGMTLIQPQVIPQITKGNWYKCTQAGHIYFVPAKYRSPPPSCTDCRAKKLDQ